MSSKRSSPQTQIKKRKIDEAHRSKKVEIYSSLLEITTRTLSNHIENLTIKPPTEQELIEFMLNFKSQVVLWGSPKVIKAQLEFQKVSSENGDVLLSVDKLYKAIREDIGLSNDGLNERQLVSLFINNQTDKN